MIHLKPRFARRWRAKQSFSLGYSLLPFLLDISQYTDKLEHFRGICRRDKPVVQDQIPRDAQLQIPVSEESKSQVIFAALDLHVSTSRLRWEGKGSETTAAVPIEI